MRRRLLAGVVLLTSLIALTFVAGCGSSSTTSGNSNTGAAVPGNPRLTIVIKNYAFSPSNPSVKVSTVVTWVNEDSVPHTVTMATGPGVSAQPLKQGANSGTLAPGKSWSWQVLKQGTWFYMCTLHPSMPSMHAQIRVTSAQ